jgi:hypothetical protein
MVDMENKYNEIRRLRNTANEMIEERLPNMWKDGDVRYLDNVTYTKISGLMEQANLLEFGNKYGKTASLSSLRRRLTFVGQFGSIEIRNAMDLRNDVKEDE